MPIENDQTSKVFQQIGSEVDFFHLHSMTQTKKHRIVEDNFHMLLPVINLL